MKTILLLLILFLFGLSAHSQNNSLRSQAVFMEIKGSGVNLTINYDSRFVKKSNGFGGRVGVGFFGDRWQKAFNLPVEINYLIGNRFHFLELGTGIVWGNYDEISDDQKGFADAYLTPLDGFGFNLNIGYRYQKPERIMFKLNFTPLFTTSKIYHLAGISCGYSF